MIIDYNGRILKLNWIRCLNTMEDAIAIVPVPYMADMYLLDVRTYIHLSTYIQKPNDFIKIILL